MAFPASSYAYDPARFELFGAAWSARAAWIFSDHWQALNFQQEGWADGHLLVVVRVCEDSLQEAWR